MIDYFFTTKMIVDDLIKLLFFQKHQIFIQQLKLINMKNLIDQKKKV